MTGIKDGISGGLSSQDNSDGYNPPYKQPRVEIKGKEGALIIFRAPLLHDVTRNNTKEDRISLSFNIRFER